MGLAIDTYNYLKATAIRNALERKVEAGNLKLSAPLQRAEDLVSRLQAKTDLEVERLIDHFA